MEAAMRLRNGIGREAIAGLLLAAAGCATPAPGPGPAVAYRALGQEPGWSLTITGGRLDYAGNYGESRIEVASPAPRTIPGGYRYETPRLIVEIAHGRCNDAMSGHGYED